MINKKQMLFQGGPKMLFDFLNSLQCVLKEEELDYKAILKSWQQKDCHTAFMPAIHWYNGTYNLFDQKAGREGKDMIWIIPAGQAHFFWLPQLKRQLEGFYENDEIDLGNKSYFPGIEMEGFEECILLNSNDLQNDLGKTILGANAVLIRLSLTSGGDTLLFVLLDHQDHCWRNIIEKYNISLTWFVDSGRGTEDYFVYINLYKMMKNTSHPEILPALYFKGLYNKGEIPEGFKFLYAMLSRPDADGYDNWLYFSAVFETGWNSEL